MLGELLDPATAQRYGRNGRRYAEENHDIKKIVEEYKTIFRQICSVENIMRKCHPRAGGGLGAL